MQLADVWIHGIRRFGGHRPHRLRVDTKLVCLIGANEAGKSTVLDALSMARHGGALEPRDRSRRQQVPDDREAVRLKYRLDPDDVEALAGIETDEDVSAIRWFEVVYRADGARRTGFEPHL